MASTVELTPGPVPDGAAPTSAPRGLAALALVIGCVFAAPLGYLAIRTVSEGADAGSLGDAAGPLGRSLWLAATVAAATSVLGTAMAWVLHRTDVPGRRVLRVLAPLPMVYPSFVGTAALIATFGPGGLLAELAGLADTPRVEGFWAAWLSLVLFTYPLVYLPVAARLRALPPSLEESARLLGRSPVQVVRSVVLPQALPAVRAGGLLVFLYTLSDFGVVAQVRYDTLTRAIYESRLLDRSRSFTLALVLGVVAVVVVVAERAATRRLPDVELDRRRLPSVLPLGRWRWVAFAGAAFVLLNALGGPLVALVWWAWRGLTQRPDAWGELSNQLGDLAVPTLNTALVGLGGAALAVAVVLPVAWLTVRHRSRAGGVAGALIVAGYALPGIAIALALAFWSLSADAARFLYQSMPLLLAAYVLHFGAQSMRASQVAVAAVPRRLGEAARLLGAARWRRLWEVEVRAMAPGLLAGAGLVLLSIMKELPATLLLHPTGFDTLATRIWPALEGHFLARAGIGSLVLVALSGVLTFALVIRRSEAWE